MRLIWQSFSSSILFLFLTLLWPLDSLFSSPSLCLNLRQQQKSQELPLASSSSSSGSLYSVHDVRFASATYTPTLGALQIEWLPLNWPSSNTSAPSRCEAPFLSLNIAQQPIAYLIGGLYNVLANVSVTSYNNTGSGGSTDVNSGARRRLLSGGFNGGGNNNGNPNSSAPSNGTGTSGNGVGGSLYYTAGSNDIWIFTLLSSNYPQPVGSWTLFTSHAPYQPRIAHSATFRQPSSLTPSNLLPHILVYGGISAINSYYLDDLYDFDLNTGLIQQRRAPSSTILTSNISLAPSARAYTKLQAVSISVAALLSLASPSSPLATASLQQFLSASANVASQEDDFFLVFGGRSDPSTIYSTEISNTTAATPFLNNTSPNSNTSLASSPAIFSTYFPGIMNDTSSTSGDYADLWLYSYSNDQWLRIGNLTCLAQSYQCADSTSVDQLLSAQLLNNLTSIQNLVYTISRPAGIPALLSNVTYLFSSILNSLIALQNTLFVNASLTQNDNSGCSFVCSDYAEITAPKVSFPLDCTVGGGYSTTGQACPFYTYLSGDFSVLFQQARPPQVEGAATATLTLLPSASVNGSRSIYFQFGGFSCAHSSNFQGSVFVEGGFASQCFTNTLYALDGFSSTLFWWSITPLIGSSSSYFWPTPRAYAAMAIDDTLYQPLLYVYGGAVYSEGYWNYFNDLYVFDILAVTWLEILATGLPPTAVRSPSLTFMPALGASSATYASPYSTAQSPQNLILYGGCVANSIASNQQYLLRTNAAINQYNILPQGTGLSNATAGVPATFYLLMVDSLTNNPTFTVLPYATNLASFFSFQWSVADDNGNAEFSTPPALQIFDQGSGVYLVNYTALQGYYLTLSISYRQPGAAPSHSTQQLIGSPFSIVLQPNVPVANHSILVYSNYTTVAKNTYTSLVLQLRDVYDNPIIGQSNLLQILNPSSSSSPSASKTQTSLASPFLLYTAPITAPIINLQGVNLSSITSWSSVSDVYWTLNADNTITLTYLVPSVDEYLLYLLFNQELYQGAPYLIQALDPMTLSNSVIVAFLILSILLGICVSIAMTLVVVNRNNRLVRAGSPLFMALICLGALLCIISVPIYAYASSITCRLFPFLLTTGYILCLGSMFIKAYRVLLIFGSASSSSTLSTANGKTSSMPVTASPANKTIFTQQNLTDSHMMLLVLLLLLVESIINVAWLIASPLTLSTLYSQDSPPLPYTQCTSSHATIFIACSVAFNCVIALWGVYLAIAIRHVPQAFNESRLMGAALYNLALCLVLVIPLTWTAPSDSPTHVNFILPATIILWCCAITVGLTVMPKLYYCYYPPASSFFEANDTTGLMIRGVKGRKITEQEDSTTNQSAQHQSDNHTSSSSAQPKHHFPMHASSSYSHLQPTPSNTQSHYMPSALSVNVASDLDDHALHCDSPAALNHSMQTHLQDNASTASSSASTVQSQQIPTTTANSISR